jgi:hypothetical protein
MAKESITFSAFHGSSAPCLETSQGNDWESEMAPLLTEEMFIQLKRNRGKDYERE